MKKKRKILACLFSIAMLINSFAIGTATAETAAKTETKIGGDVQEEIEAGTEWIPVIVTIQVGAEQYDLLHTQYLAVVASETQKDEKVAALQAQIDDAAEQIRKGNMTQQEYDSLYQMNNQEIESLEETFLKEKEQLLQNANDISQNEFQNKLSQWELNEELRFVATYPDSCIYGVSGKLTADMIEKLSNDADVQSIALSKEMGIEGMNEPEPQQIYGDFNHDGIVNASDAAIMLIYAAEHGAGMFNGSFEEYVNR